MTRRRTTVEAVDANENFINEIAATLTMSAYWDDFVEAIKYKNRFFHADAFSEILKMLIHCKKVIREDSIFYRARQLNASLYANIEISDAALGQSGIGGLSPQNMGAPPKGKATSGRANPAGISYLYLASKPQIACAEVQPTLFDLISVGQFKLNRRIKVINLKNPTIPVSTTVDNHMFKEFIIRLEHAFSDPIREKSDLEYASSQYISAYAQNNGFDGIIYGSMNDTKSKSYNLVLFDPSLAEMIENKTQVYQLRKKKLVFQNFSILAQETISAASNCSLAESEEIRKMRSRLKKHQTLRT